jgi:hypothetical protein
VSGIQVSRYKYREYELQVKKWQHSYRVHHTNLFVVCFVSLTVFVVCFVSLTTSDNVEQCSIATLQFSLFCAFFKNVAEKK